MSIQATFTQFVLLNSVEPHISNKPSCVLIWQSMSESLESKESVLHRFTFPPIVGMCSNDYIFHFNSDIDIWSFLGCRGMSWLHVWQVLNLSELPLWIYRSLYASTPRRTGLIFCLGCITLYINFTTFAKRYFYTRIHFMYGRP